MPSTSDILQFAFSGAAFALALFVLAALGMKRIETRSGPTLHLDAMIVFMLAQCMDTADSLAFSGVFQAPPQFAVVALPFYPLFMISLWIFVRALTMPDARLYRRDLKHLLPIGLSLLFLLPFVLLPADQKAALLSDDAPELEIDNWHLLLTALGDLAYWLLWTVLLAVYGTRCARRLLRHKRNIRALYSNLEGKSLWWLTGLVVSILVLSWINVIDEVAALFVEQGWMADWSVSVQEVVISSLMGLFALRAEPPLSSWTGEVIAAPAPAPVAPPSTAETTELATTEGPRYARSGLSPDRIRRLAEKIERAMTQDQLWRRHALKLKDLSDITGVTTIHISEVLNTHFGKSFYDYVNGYRIEDACALLENADRSILEISEEVGFNSKSTFNTHFKRITGRTPSSWRAALRRDAQIA